MRKRIRVSRHIWGWVVMGLCALLGLGGIALAERGPIDKPAVDQSLTTYTAGQTVSGSLKLAGSDTMQPLLTRLAKEFRRYHANAIVTVEGGGSSAAIKQFLETRPRSQSVSKRETEEPTLLVASSRTLSGTEIKQFVSKHGYPPMAFPVAVDAVGIYVHRDNPLTRLTLEQVDAIFSTTRHRGYATEIKEWGQLGLNSGWEHAAINRYGRDQKSGTRAFIKEHVLENGEFTVAVHEEPGAASVILALSRDPFGVGYSGIGLQASTVRAVLLAEKDGMPFVQPSADSVLDESYPLRRFLYIYADKLPRAPLPAVAQEFIAFVNSREGQEAAIRAGFYPLPIKQIQQSRTALTLPESGGR
jgi:phosphate transport system substrate-binding protein